MSAATIALGGVLRHAVRSLVLGWRTIAALLVAVLPVLLALLLLVVREGLGLRALSPNALYRLLAAGYFHTAAILLGVLFGTSAVSDDEEDGSVVYLLVRPVRRGVVYLGKTAAAAAVCLGVLVPSVTATFVTLSRAASGGPPLATYLADLGWLSLAGIAYPVAFAAVASIVRRPLLGVALYLFLWEVPMAFAPSPLRLLTVSHYLLSLMPYASPWNAAVTALGMVTPKVAAVIGLAALCTALLALGAFR